MIEKEKPDLILIVNEYGNFERALAVAGKLKVVSTLAVQHGVITPTHSGYMFDKEVKGKVILPDITCVYGQYYYDLLTKNSIYEPEQVVITGQPRYDVLYHADKLYSKEKFLKRYNINHFHKIVLWTTQCHGISNEENKKNFKSVFGTMQHLKDVTLIIKQHPGEGKRYTKMIKDYLDRYKIDAVITPESSDTYEQLFVCDLMITRHSTTAMEAIALNKPVIILNLSGEPDLVDYVGQSVALGVYKEEDFKPAIEKILKDDSELAKNRGRYIEKYLYKIEGKATERVVNLISRVIGERMEKNET
jgi:CDP-glycerol glycerophosphotransferase (TagB/SpsB family)